MARNATKCVIDGFDFDSLTESRRYLYLKELEKCGEISDLKRQIKHELLPAYTVDGRKVRGWNYISDFEYYDELERIYVIEDVKGRPEPIDKYKRKMFEWNNRDGINRREMKFFWICEAPKYYICDGGECWIEYEELVKVRKEHKKKVK